MSRQSAGTGNKISWHTDVEVEANAVRTRAMFIAGIMSKYQLHMTPEDRQEHMQHWLDVAAAESDTRTVRAFRTIGTWARLLMYATCHSCAIHSAM